MGSVQFPRPPAFLLQATLNDIIESATIALIDINTNISMDAGLTNASGDFILSPTPAVLNNDGAFYWLEANKRLVLVGAEALFLRTIVRRTQGRFVSITNGLANPFDKTLINSMTTAVAIAELLDNTITPQNVLESVNKAVLTKNLSAASTLNAVNAIKAQVELNLTNNSDPLKDGTYALNP